MPNCQWPITAISYDRVVARISIKLCTQYRLVILREGDLSRLRYTGDHLSYAEGKPFDLTQSFYTAL